MTSGFEIETSDGTIFQVILGDDGNQTVISHGKVEVIVDLDGEEINAKVSAGGVEIVGVSAKELDTSIKSDAAEITEGADILRRCRSCNGSQCCVSNGCVNCGCGWVCDGRARC